MPLPKVLRELLTLPTAAFVETAVSAYVLTALRKLPDVNVTVDRYGNILAHFHREPRHKRPLVFAAHMDHPGFCALHMRDRRTLIAAFRGWVEPEYFTNAGVRFWSDGKWVRGRIVELVKTAPVYGLIGRTARPEEVAVQVAGPVAPNAPGMWDLPDPALRGDKVFARGCDDLAGCAAMLALLQRLGDRNAECDCYCIFTRAEEVGFVGAIASARFRTIPVGLPIISIETSKALTPDMIGSGPILRVGDKSSIFTPALTAFCDRVAKQLLGVLGADGKPRVVANRRAAAKAHARRTPTPPSARGGRRAAAFAYQRRLMDGGTCEATAYLAYGYPATGICVALGNYHNMDSEKQRIASEYISLSDWQRMVRWFEALVLDPRGWGGEDAILREQMDQRYEAYLPLLHPRPEAAVAW